VPGAASAGAVPGAGVALVLVLPLVLPPGALFAKIGD